MRILLIILTLSTSAMSFGHKYYITIADMEYDSTENRINVSLKMTAHDFEWVMGHQLSKEISLEKVTDSSEGDHFIQQYLKHNFKIFIDDQQLKMNYLGFEVTNRDDLYCYFFFPNVSACTTIKIINKLLFSVSDQQQNIVHFKCLDHTKSVTLIPSKYEERITFNEHEDD